MEMTSEEVEHLLSIRRKYGWCCSYAIWANSNGAGPKCGISDLSVLAIRKDNPFLDQRNSRYVLVGLNISRTDSDNPGAVETQDHEPAFMNFHSGYARSRDFQLRRALEGTPVWGSWMTDIIKGYPKLKASEVMRDIRLKKLDVAPHIANFENELIDIGVKNPILIALGKDVHEILCKNLDSKKHQIFRMTHYSAAVKSDVLRREVLDIVRHNS